MKGKSIKMAKVNRLRSLFHEMGCEDRDILRETGGNMWSAKRMTKLLMKASVVSVLLFVFILICTVSASPGPGVELTITPRNISVLPGETATYTVVVKSITTELEHVSLSMEDEVPGWSYAFSNPEFNISQRETITSTLVVSVPSTATVGAHESKVKAEALVPGWPPEFAEKSYFTIMTITILRIDATLPVLSPTGLAVLIGLLSIIAVCGIKRRDNG